MQNTNRWSKDYNDEYHPQSSRPYLILFQRYHVMSLPTSRGLPTLFPTYIKWKSFLIHLSRLQLTITYCCSGYLLPLTTWTTSGRLRLSALAWVSISVCKSGVIHEGVWQVCFPLANVVMLVRIQVRSGCNATLLGAAVFPCVFSVFPVSFPFPFPFIFFLFDLSWWTFYFTALSYWRGLFKYSLVL